VRVLARLLDCSFKRIQFTPDLMPADIIGTNIYDSERHVFQFRPGPLFAELVLGDEINRAPAKTQSALLEAMQETPGHRGRHHPSAAGQLHRLATQNRSSRKAPTPLPEAQLDRFMMKVRVHYPDEAQEVDILRVHQQGIAWRTSSVSDSSASPAGRNLLAAQEAIRARTIRDEVLAYIARLVRATRDHPKVEVGASPRPGSWCYPPPRRGRRCTAGVTCCPTTSRRSPRRCCAIG